MNTGLLLEYAIEAALKAGKAILEVYNSTHIEVHLKSDRSPLTLADLNAHRTILSVLKATQLPVLSEEGKDISYETRKEWKRFWMVDPLDGTKEFIKRNGEFTVNIALIEADKPVAGVIYTPVLDELHIGEQRMGAYKFRNVSNYAEEKVHLDSLLKKGIRLPVQKDKTAYMIAGSRSHLSEENRRFIDKVLKEHPGAGMISRGSSLKLCLVAEGFVDIYPRMGPTMEWDTAAGNAIVEAAGFSMTDFNTGKALQYNKGDLRNPWFIAG